MINFAPLSPSEEILVAIIDKTPYTKLPNSRVEALLIQLKEAFDDWVW
jgi:hypothetical protein